MSFEDFFGSLVPHEPSPDTSIQVTFVPKAGLRIRNPTGEGYIDFVEVTVSALTECAYSLVCAGLEPEDLVLSSSVPSENPPGLFEKSVTLEVDYSSQCTKIIQILENYDLEKSLRDNLISTIKVFLKYQTLRKK